MCKQKFNPSNHHNLALAATKPANAPIKQMEFVLNRILSKTWAISIVF